MGISGVFGLVYVATPQMFPTVLAASAFGICNMFARLSAVISPEVSELHDPIPMTIFTISSLASAFLPIFLNTDRDDKSQKDTDEIEKEKSKSNLDS